MDSSTYTLASYSYTPTTTGDYYFGLQSANKSATRSYMCFDDISISSATPSFAIQGDVIYANKLLPIPNATVSVSGSHIDTSVITGTYSFNENAGGNYTLKASKNNDVNKTNGVTAIDLVLIQSHILGKNMLNSPYKIIAADVNGCLLYTSPSPRD